MIGGLIVFFLLVDDYRVWFVRFCCRFVFTWKKIYRFCQYFCFFFSRFSYLLPDFLLLLLLLSIRLPALLFFFLDFSSLLFGFLHIDYNKKIKKDFFSIIMMIVKRNEIEIDNFFTKKQLKKVIDFFSSNKFPKRQMTNMKIKENSIVVDWGVCVCQLDW